YTSGRGFATYHHRPVPQLPRVGLYIGNIDELEPELRAGTIRGSGISCTTSCPTSVDRRVSRQPTTCTWHLTSCHILLQMFTKWVCFLSLLVLPAAQATAKNCSITFKANLPTILECPGTNIKFYFYEGDHQLQIVCSDKPNFRLLRRFQNPFHFTFQELVYKDCPLPAGNQSFVELLTPFLDRNQLYSIRSLFLDNNVKHNEQVDAQIFADLPLLTTLEIENWAEIDNPLLFEQLPHLAHLATSGRNNVSGKMLHPLQNLAQLTIKDMDIATLPTATVTNLTKLMMLTLTENKFERIEQLAELPKLMLLNLSSNHLTTLQKGVFDNLPTLYELYLSSNKLTSLPSGLFAKNKHLLSLVAVNQQGTGLVLEAGLFAGMKRLLNVVLSGNKITTLPERLFQNATRLTIIDLRDNRLQSLPKSLLSNSSNLKKLYLQHNELMHMLPDTLLHGAPQLRILNLSHNNLTTLSKHLLKSQIALEELHLKYNQLYTIDKDAFNSQSTSLKLLNLSHNRLALYENSSTTTSWISFSTLNQLLVLDLSYNAIAHISGHFRKLLGSLRSLDLSNNQITHIDIIDISFQSPHIKQLNLTSNYITHLDGFDINHTNTENHHPRKMLLADNPLNCDCPLIALLEAQSAVGIKFPLRGLRCVPFCEIDAYIGFCPNGCTCYKRPVERIAIVNCTAANLTRVPTIASPSIVDCDFIELHLEQNMLHDLANAGEGWNNVHKLYIANNSLATLTGDSLPEQLELLDVSGNQLTKLDVDFILKLDETPLSTISLSANPWECYCENAFLEYVTDNAALIADYSTLQCSDGQPINSHTLYSRCSTPSLSTFQARHFTGLWHKFDTRWIAAQQQQVDKRYDAYISYSPEDGKFVQQLITRLESDELNFQLCWDVRDFMPSMRIASQVSYGACFAQLYCTLYLLLLSPTIPQITQAIENSERIIIVLSRHYLESAWGQMEFSIAHLQSLVDRRNRIIPIIYDDIGNVGELEPELRAYLQNDTSLSWNDSRFWEKLRHVMSYKNRTADGQKGTNDTVSKRQKERQDVQKKVFKTFF
uniref:TIR domain-containing protein n=1 Tax=Anopheles christyi TaxID=43041 RepID=A0A3F2YTZ3_9DIPT